MKSFRTGAIAIPLLFAPVASIRAAYVTERSFSSPDGNLTFTLERNDSDNRFYWSLNRAGAVIVNRGALGIDLSTVGTVADEGSISAVATRDIDTSWTPPYGERSIIPDHFHEETLTLASADQGTLAVKLQVRAYDEGFAFRYLVNGTGTLTMSGEKTSYPLPASAMVWATSSSQGTISKVAITSMSNGMERPLTAELAPDLFIALGEAGSFDYARMKFSRTGTSTLIPSLGGSSTFTNSLTTPWRFVRAASTPAGLLQGNPIMWNLSEPSRVADTSWIKPGKMIREVTLTTGGGIACVDLAAARGLDYVHLDAGWYGPENSASSDATTVNVDPARSPGPLDLQAVIAYAHSKNIGVILYVNHIALEQQLDAILPLYQQWGVAGIKFGFVNTGSQTWTKWMHDAIEKCAQYHLMVDVHDDYRMTGVERTLPNFMTAEGVAGDETSPPNEMVLKTIFTRCLAGAADQTNCYFATRVPTMGSHASQLAKSVCIYSPWQFLYWYDSPENSPNVGGKSTVILDVPELSFFQRLPTVWDETRWLQGHPDTHAVVSRRKGDTWFLAALNGSATRDFVVPLDFLPSGQNFRIELFSDDPAVATATDVQIETGVIDRNFAIARRVALRNGLTAILTPTADALAPLLPTVAVDPPPPPPPPLPGGTHTFETNQGYPAAPGTVAGINANPNGAAFAGVNGWSLSSANNGIQTFATSTSGEYQGGQALGASGSGTYIGAITGGIVATGANTIRFDAPFYTGTAVGLSRDLDGDGLFDNGTESGMQFAIGGTPARFNYRNANFGTENFGSGFTGTTGQWYRFLVTIGDSIGGVRNLTMAVRNLTTGADFDFNSATAGIQPWSFTVTDAQFGPAPELAQGLMLRATSSARIDNLFVSTATLPGGPAYNAWMCRVPDLSEAERQPDADPDHDGGNNLLEFVLDGDPSVADSSIQPQASKVGGNLVLTFKRRDDSESSTALQLQVGVNLTGWPTTATIGAADGSAGGIGWTVTENGANPDLITVTIPEGTDTAKFVRLKVTGLQ